MQSILLVSENREKAKEYIDKISRSEKVDPIDIAFHSFEKAVGIEEIREIRRRIFLTPVKSQTKIIIIEAFEGITIESQNALLKILEEPPNNTTIVIAIDRIGLILPTILSRCKIIDLKQKSYNLSKQEITQYLNALISLSSIGVGDKLKLAQDIAKNKEEVIPWLERMIIVARGELIDSACHSEPFDFTQGKLREESRAKARSFADTQDDNGKISQYLNILISLQRTFTVLKTTNVNPRIILENLFLNL